ncbi:MAG: hypothetical protein ACR2HJ_00830 [Fimbriimonadales bacterium]
MTCNQLNHGAFRRDEPYLGTWPGILANGGPELMLSNSPELIPVGLALPATLYRCSMGVSAGGRSVRSYLWHKNNTISPINVGLVGGVSTGPVTLSNIRVQKEVGSSLPSMGICTAKAQLYNSYNSVAGSIVLSADQMIMPAVATLQPGQTLGCVLEFDATGSFLGSVLFSSHRRLHGFSGRCAEQL